MPERGGGARWLNITEAAAYLGVSTKTIRRWIHAGAIQSELRPGRTRPQYVVPLADLDARRPDRRPAQADLVEMIHQQLAHWDEALAAHLASDEQRLARVEDELRRLNAAVQRRDHELDTAQLVARAAGVDGPPRHGSGSPHAGTPHWRDDDVVAALCAGLSTLRAQLAASAANADLALQVEHLAALADRLASDRVPAA